MSQFLGPIHHIVYEKVLRTEEKVEEIALLSDKEGWSQDLYTKLDSVKEKPIIGDLEKIIDHGNIHGWLNEMVERVEARYAYTIDNILKEDKEKRFEKVKTIEKSYGEKAAASLLDSYSLEEIFFTLRNTMLDGMPCDGGIATEEEENDRIVFSINMQAHPYFLENDLEEEFLDLREAWLDGFCQAGNLEGGRIERSNFYIGK